MDQTPLRTYFSSLPGAVINKMQIDPEFAELGELLNCLIDPLDKINDNLYSVIGSLANTKIHKESDEFELSFTNRSEYSLAKLYDLSLNFYKEHGFEIRIDNRDSDFGMIFIKQPSLEVCLLISDIGKTYLVTEDIIHNVVNLGVRNN